jgi:glyoxalase family protein
MNELTKGIHHITAVVGDPQENIDFYAGVLGLRMIKQTVNFDEPGTYHLYFADEVGNPGTVITFFPVPNGTKGVIGDGQVGETHYAVPVGALSFWKKRLSSYGITFKEEQRFGFTHILFEDVHGLKLSLVETSEGKLSEWEFEDITSQVAIKGFFGATLYTHQFNETNSLISRIMGLEFIGEDEAVIRYKGSAPIGSYIDIMKQKTTRGIMGVGVVHHIAMRASDDADQIHMMNQIRSAKYQTTNVIDRNYFHSIYFRERGGILFEIATDQPGFMIDETKESLGSTLQLPKQYESLRQNIEQNLLPIVVRTVPKKGSM